MDLVLEMCNTNSIHWCGISGRQLGKLHPSSSLCLALTLLSSVQGLQSVSGLRLTDTFLKRTYEYDDIAQVCVVSSAIKVESWRKLPFLFLYFHHLCKIIKSTAKISILFKFLSCKKILNNCFEQNYLPILSCELHAQWTFVHFLLIFCFIVDITWTLFSTISVFDAICPKFLELQSVKFLCERQNGFYRKY